MSRGGRQGSAAASPHIPTGIPASLAAVMMPRMERSTEGWKIVQPLHLGVAPVHGHGVLGQVVGADGEEVALLGQQVGDEGGGGVSTMMPTLMSLS